MEILAINETYVPAIILTAFLGLMLAGLPFIVFDKSSDTFDRVFSGFGVILIVVILTAVWLDPTVVTYDAIITDWNEVYEQGYEVVETNGKIVTLRKVDE